MHLQAARSGIGGDVDGELGETWLERLEALSRALRPVGAVLGVGRGGGVLEGDPGARCLTVLLVAVAEIEEGASSRIESRALRELRAGVGVLAVGHELAGLLEEGLGGGLARGPFCQGAARSEEREGEREEGGATEASHESGGYRTSRSRGGHPILPGGPGKMGMERGRGTRTRNANGDGDVNANVDRDGDGDGDGERPWIPRDPKVDLPRLTFH